MGWSLLRKPYPGLTEKQQIEVLDKDVSTLAQ